MKFSIAALVAVGALSIQADLLIFDDAAQNGFISNSNNQIVDATALAPHQGDFSVRRGDGDTGLGPIFDHPGFSYGTNNILSFWINSDTTGNVGFDKITMRDENNTLIEIKNGQGELLEWVVNGTAQSGPVFLENNDPQVWDHVTFDLSQPYYVWEGGKTSKNLASDTVITRFEVGLSDDSTAVMGYMDTVSLVAIPEPGTLVLVLFAGLAALFFRRRR